MKKRFRCKPDCPCTACYKPKQQRIYLTKQLAMQLIKQQPFYKVAINNNKKSSREA